MISMNNPYITYDRADKVSAYGFFKWTRSGDFSNFLHQALATLPTTSAIFVPPLLREGMGMHFVLVAALEYCHFWVIVLVY
jgi:hypothetical protein